MKRLVLLLLPLAVTAREPNRHEGTYLHQIRTTVETPHTKWLKPNPAGKPGVLFLVRRPGVFARKVVEIYQRMELDYTAFVFVPSERERDYWEANIAGSRTPEKKAEAIQKLSQLYDCIVLIHFDPRWLPPQAYYYLLKQVKGGCGLVAVNSRLPFKLKVDTRATALVASGVPLSILPAYSSLEKLRAVGAKTWRDLPGKIIRAGTFDRGRAVSLRFPSTSCEPQEQTYADYYYAFLIRAIRWAIPSLQPSASLSSLPEGIQIPRDSLASSKPRIAINSSSRQRLTLRMSIRHPLLGKLWSSRKAVDLKPGENPVELTLPPLPAGDHFYDLQLTNNKGVLDFASFGFSVLSQERIAELSLEKAFLSQKDTESRYAVRFTKPLTEDSALRISVEDTYGRLLALKTHKLRKGSTSVTGSFSLKLVVALAQWVRAELLRDHRPLDAVQTLLIIRRDRPFEYPALLWGTTRGGLDALTMLRRQRKVGFNILLTGVDPKGLTARTAALADMQLCIYATRIGGVSDGKKGKVSNPEVMNNWIQSVVEKCKNSTPYGVYIYSLGDECYMGSYQQSLAPSDVRAFREFLKTRYPSIDELNKVWKTKYKSFDEIKPVDWKKGLSDPKLFPQLHERASFIEHLYAEAMHRFDQALTAMDSSARVGAEGSLPGDLELTIRGLEMWGPYARRRFDVLLASIAPRELIRGMWWGGYHGRLIERSTAVRSFWRQVLEGAANTNYFFNGLPGHHESNCSSDFTWAKYFERMIPDIEKIYETPGPLLSNATFEDFGIALLWSQPSEHASLFYAPFGNPATECTTIFQFLDSFALNYRFITSRMVEQNLLRYPAVKLFIIPNCTAISEKEKTALEKYVSHGGVLLATGTSGLMDNHCRMLDKPALDHLLGISRRAKSKPQKVKISSSSNPPAQHLADTSLRTPSATVLISAGNTPILTLNKLHRGKAFFFNGSLSALVKAGEAGKALRERVLRIILDEAKIKPLLTIEPNHAGRAYSFRVGSALLVSFIGKPETRAKIKLNHHYYAYNTLNTKPIGRTSHILHKPEEGLFGLYCLLDKKASAPQIKINRSPLRGELLDLTVSAAKGRLIRVETFRPDGQWLRTMRRFVKLDDTPTRLTIPVALNEPAGKWTLKATDLATGLHSTLGIEIK